MKAILEFNLPEDKEEFENAVKGMNWALTLWELDNFLRNKLKHGHDFHSIDGALEAVRTKLYEVMEDQDVSFDMIS